MGKTRPIYWKLLTAAVVIYVVSTTIMLSDIYSKIGEIEHTLVRENTAHSGHHH